MSCLVLHSTAYSNEALGCTVNKKDKKKSGTAASFIEHYESDLKEAGFLWKNNVQLGIKKHLKACA